MNIVKRRVYGIMELVFLSILLFSIILFPNIALASVALIFAILLIVQGIVAFIIGMVDLGFVPGSLWQLIYGAVSIGLGFIILWDPAIGIQTLIYLLAGWILFTGLLNIIEQISIRETYAGEIPLFIGGSLSIILALFLFFSPEAAIAPLLWFLAIYLVIQIVFGWAQMERVSYYETVKATKRRTRRK